MDVGRAIRTARRRAGMSQRELAERAGLPQSTVARIESGFVDPRTTTVVKLLNACGERLEAIPRIGTGVDRSRIRALLQLTPQQRLDAAVAAANNVRALLRSMR